MIKKNGLKSLITVFLLAAFFFGGAKCIFTGELSDPRKECMECHKKVTPGLYSQWKNSVHASPQHNIGCYDCHQANRGDVDAFVYGGKEKILVSVIVSPKDCARCHMPVVRHFDDSRHAGTVKRTLDSKCSNLVKTVISAGGFTTPGFTGHALTGNVTGCAQCHGSRVKVKQIKKKDGEVIKIEYDAATWPNEGIGRINPDKSTGSCIACHQRHEFSPAQARQPESCGKCHVLGSGNPMLDIYKASDHGRAYYTNKGKMNLDADVWTLGETYSATPTCATCHMGKVLLIPGMEKIKAKYMSATHNVSLRFNWDNSPPDKKTPCKCPPDKRLPCECNNGLAPASNPPGACDDGRPVNNDQVMQKVCLSCHRYNFLDGYCSQRKGQEQMIRDKYLIPGNDLYTGAKRVLHAIASAKKIGVKPGKYAYFTYPIDYIWLEIGDKSSQANIAVVKGSPDYAYTGNLSLVELWFRDFVPELRRIIEKGKSSSNSDVQAAAKSLKKALHETLKKSIYGKEWENKYNLECNKKSTGN